MAPRVRVIAFGSAAALVVAGAACAALISGVTGQVLAIALITFGLGAVVLLLFLEVGLSEDRERSERFGRPSHDDPVDADREQRSERFFR